MKIYIVTSTDDFAYRIEKVFIDPDKAEEYAALCDTYGEAIVEEHETSDDKEISKINYISCDYEVNDEEGELFEFSVEITNTLDSDISNMDRTGYSEYLADNSKSIYIQRVINSDTYDEEKLKLKYQKACRDLMEIIKSLKAIEGWNEKMIQEWLTAKKDNFIPVSE